MRVCFSPEADVVAGVALLPIAVLTLREVRHIREVPFAALPLLFALHQLIEVFVWLGDSGDVSACVAESAATAYVLFALPVLPTLVSLSVLLLEPRGSRLRVAPFVVLGFIVSAYLAQAVISGPIRVDVRSFGIVYDVGLSLGVLWAVLYIVATIGPSLLSGYPSIVAFGVLNLVGLTIVALTYVSAFASLWCIWAAISSVLVFRHMRLRRELSAGQRLHGEPIASR